MVLSKIIDITADGDTTILSVEDDTRVRLHAALVSVEGDVTGTILLKAGSTVIGKIRNPFKGYNHLLLIGTSNYFYQGDNGEDLIINGGGATTNFTITLIYKIHQ